MKSGLLILLVICNACAPNYEDRLLSLARFTE